MTSHSRQRTRLADRTGFIAWVLAAPAIVYLLAFIVGPLALTGRLAYTGVSGHFLADPGFRQALLNSVIVTSVSVPLIVIAGLIAGHVLAARFHGRWIVRLLVLLPWAAPAALSAVLWQSTLGSVSLVTVIMVQVWRLVPLAAVITLAGLRTVPRDLAEAAFVDGAGPWRRLFEVTLPQIRPMIALSAFVAGLVTLTDVSVPYVLRGPPLLASEGYRLGMGGDPDRGAAMVVALIPLVACCVIGFRVAARRRETTC